MIVVCAQSDRLLFPRKLLESKCAIFNNELDANAIRLPFPSESVATFLRALRWVSENDLPAAPMRHYVRERLTNDGQWRFTFDLESYVGSEMFRLLRNKRVVEGMVAVWHYTHCECMNKLVSAAYMYHGIVQKS